MEGRGSEGAGFADTGWFLPDTNRTAGLLVGPVYTSGFSRQAFFWVSACKLASVRVRNMDPSNVMAPPAAFEKRPFSRFAQSGA